MFFHATNVKPNATEIQPKFNNKSQPKFYRHVVQLETMSTLEHRLKEIMEPLGHSPADLARIAGVSYQAASKWCDGRTKSIRADCISKVADHYGVTERWLNDGRLPKERNAVESVVQHDPLSYIPKNSVTDMAYDSFDELPDDDFKFVSSFDVELSAGQGSEPEWIEREKNLLPFKASFFRSIGVRKPDACKLLRVRGESMCPTLNSKDSVLIDTSDTRPSDGEIYAALWDGNLLIKRLRVTSNGMSLTSDNPDYSPIEISQDSDYERLVMLGRKVWRGG